MHSEAHAMVGRTACTRGRVLTPQPPRQADLKSAVRSPVFTVSRFFLVYFLRAPNANLSAAQSHTNHATLRLSSFPPADQILGEYYAAAWSLSFH